MCSLRTPPPSGYPMISEYDVKLSDLVDQQRRMCTSEVTGDRELSVKKLPSIARWPEYLSREFEHRFDNNELGGLWVAEEFDDLPEPIVTYDHENTLCHIAVLASGIVIRKGDAPHVLCLPGFLTTFEMTTPTVRMADKEPA